MLTADGCRSRRLALISRLNLSTDLVLADPIHLRYFANFYVDPFSLGADYGAVLVIRPDGHATVYHDKRLPETIQQARVDERVILPWYDGLSAGHGDRRAVLLPVVQNHGGRVHDSLGDPLAAKIYEAMHDLRREKHADEIDQLKECMRVGKAGQDWGRANVTAGMTELDVYNGIFAECSRTIGRPLILYGDFAVSPGSSRRGGMATRQVLKNGDMLILDFSVVIQGYRSDFTNTLVVGKSPTAEQTRLYEACVRAMAAGEAMLRSGQQCQAVYDAVRGSFAKDNLADQFPHHAGHGLGIGHPEAPYFVKQSSETLRENDVVTLEPGVYVDNLGGIRIEHNYRITATGFERLSQHEITLT
ncbi:M24 family metallopeptidase [Zavarzinella formosa]|uniref:M24 family metallopeptidase n=1 Tax=Zavarzinella formosa TaxID=360055 RepID=UPI0002D9DBCA|nr:Xaa-Pro peptidase family protein [Zavarzinella formosa]